MRPTLICLLFLPLVVGCGDPNVARLAGIWQGRFEAQPGEPNTKMRPEWDYRGYLQLYATKNKFKMRMESIAQIAEMDGTWAFDTERKRITLRFEKLTFDDRGGEIRRAAGVTPIDPNLVRTGYGRQMVLRLDQETNTLTGLDVTIGPLLGRHVFVKGKG